ncbi:MAG: hypothetical protein HC828_21085 [Blastochloris sp.]|nr:hypothetical protein [Blastochloris sp.]
MDATLTMQPPAAFSSGWAATGSRRRSSAASAWPDYGSSGTAPRGGQAFAVKHSRPSICLTTKPFTRKLPLGSIPGDIPKRMNIVCIGGGSGMAPIWSLLCDMAERGIQRKATYFYGARNRRDLFYLDKLEELQRRMPNFRFIPALSMATPTDEWDGETGLITDVVARHIGDGRDVQAYLCGPPPMIDAAIPVLNRLGIHDDRIFFDKFTPTGKVGD